MQAQVHPRFKKRVPCEFTVGQDNHIGVVLNVSEGGLFVSSRALPAVGSRVQIDLEPETREAAIPLRARVVWKKKVHRSLNKTGEGGIGLVIEEPSPDYERWVKRLWGTPIRDLDLPPSKSTVEEYRYQVRLALAGSPRTRSLQVEASDEAGARARALGVTGDGWSILEIKR